MSVTLATAAGRGSAGSSCRGRVASASDTAASNSSPSAPSASWRRGEREASTSDRVMRAAPQPRAQAGPLAPECRRGHGRQHRRLFLDDHVRGHPAAQVGVAAVGTDVPLRQEQPIATGTALLQLGVAVGAQHELWLDTLPAARAVLALFDLLEQRLLLQRALIRLRERLA